MPTWSIAKMLRYRRRLAGLSTRQQIYFVLAVLYGEAIRRPGHVGMRQLRWIGPRSVDLNVTERCQCRCQHCYASATEAGRSNELRTSELVAILDQIASLHALEVCFNGGEALLHADLPDLIACARGMRVQPKMVTNGVLLAPQRVAQLKEAGLAWCTVSIDSPDPEEHDRNRGLPGCFDKAISGLSEVIRQGIPAGIQTCARKEVIQSGGLERVVALGHKLGVEVVRLTFPVAMGRYEGADDQMLTLEERQYVRSLLKDPLVTVDQPAENSCCDAGLAKLAIGATGDVTPCTVLPLVFGNIRRQPLREIWESMAEFQRLPKPKGVCPMSDATFRTSLLPRKSEIVAEGPTLPNPSTGGVL